MRSFLCSYPPPHVEQNALTKSAVNLLPVMREDLLEYSRPQMRVFSSLVKFSAEDASCLAGCTMQMPKPNDFCSFLNSWHETLQTHFLLLYLNVKLSARSAIELYLPARPNLSLDERFQIPQLKLRKERSTNRQNQYPDSRFHQMHMPYAPQTQKHEILPTPDRTRSPALSFSDHSKTRLGRASKQEPF